jgi:hypothetical protein
MVSPVDPRVSEAGRESALGVMPNSVQPADELLQGLEVALHFGPDVTEDSTAAAGTQQLAKSAGSCVVLALEPVPPFKFRRERAVCVRPAEDSS